ncbi:hypothetical protein GP486_001651 [Trichoglossum hirsutum]|uniref:CCHC-type domain-containing protein n=1 Tax=Trichoglossum hirsutum TaxID=265104 RepID=A0A9P8LGL0_9PEZI|nr:hypothetical protein GP486_001651 [Trichoglossum hirsutum]
MKFMQRAAAAGSLVTPDEPSPKRQRLSSPASPATPSSDLQAVLTPQEVLDRQAAEAGETRWVLSLLEDESVTSGHKGLRVAGTTFAGLDDPKAGGLENEEQDGQAWRSNSIVGRKNFGNFKRTLKNVKESPQDDPAPSSDNVSDYEDGSDDDNVNGDDGDHTALPNNGKDIDGRAKARHKALKEAKREAEEQRKEEQLLRGISSISGGGGQVEHQQAVKRKDVQCYKCGKSGHIARDCTSRR